MGDDQHRTLIVAQRVFQPGDALGIEVVGRLVEQQQFGLFQQQLAQRHTAALTTGKGGHIGIRRRAAQRIEGDLDGAVQFPAIAGINALLQLGLLGEEGVHLLLAHLIHEGFADGVEAGEVGLHLAESLFHILAHGLVGVEMGLLAEIAHAHALGRPGLATEILVLAGHDAHQGGFTGAIGAEHADLHRGQEGERDAFEHLAAAGVGLGEVLHHVDILVGGHAGCS